MLRIKDLVVNVGEKEILKGVNFQFEVGKNYLLIGKNGSGKSSLANFLMGNPKYEYVSGEVEIASKQLLELTPDKRALEGLFLSFQNVLEIPGINLSEYLRIIYNNMLKVKNPSVSALSPFVFKRFIRKFLEELNISDDFLSRDLNVGFSGGEKRKIEILQARLLEPKYMIFDEIDSGLDLDAFKVVSDLIKKLDNENNSIIMITHNFKIINYLEFDYVYVMKNGVIDKVGGVELLNEIKEKGFGE
ncbi:MAG: Fe-S cluster assembly ATPase SufC [Candidatus Gracilibacteria bacterium]|nr:Fe-S cluster assembly ATPase SufC [Candidatus Gracilibacteria bacterium]